MKKMTRRAMVGSVLTAAALPAQTSAPGQTDYLADTVALNKRNAEALDKVKLPMSTEPAFQFKA